MVKIKRSVDKINFRAIWFLTLFEVVTNVILEISCHEISLHSPRKRSKQHSPIGKVQSSRNFQKDG